MDGYTLQNMLLTLMCVNLCACVTLVIRKIPSFFFFLNHYAIFNTQLLEWLITSVIPLQVRVFLRRYMYVMTGRGFLNENKITG